MSNPNPSPETRFQPGQSGNPSGRPKTPLKDYVRDKFSKMTEKEKEYFLRGVSKETQWKMSEGNPAQEADITSGGEAITPILVKFLDGKDNPDSGGV